MKSNLKGRSHRTQLYPRLQYALVRIYGKKLLYSRVLRSSSTAHLEFNTGPIPRTRYGKRAFSIAAPPLWNNLPVHIRASTTLDSFKTELKTHLFRSI